MYYNEQQDAQAKAVVRDHVSSIAAQTEQANIRAAAINMRVNQDHSQMHDRRIKNIFGNKF